ncbi:MAG: hypothetical protein EXS00_03065 [Phycisphaerales bacterium]|nr:hypothetical protein [Phycisphaerales bacterium]
MSTWNDIRQFDFSDLSEWCAQRRSQIIKTTVSLLILLLLSVSAYWWFEVRFRPPPSIFDTPVDGVLGYLALDDFSQLSLEERLKFLTELADRFRGMEASDSALMASFLAGLGGPAKEQLRQNVRDLAKDILADSADSYLNLPADQRGAFIDQWAVDWMKRGERLASGKDSDKSDAERLTQIRKDATRQDDRTARRQGTPTELGSGGAMQMLDLWQSEVEPASSPKEQGQIVRFLDDVRKRFSRAF